MKKRLLAIICAIAVMFSGAVSYTHIHTYIHTYAAESQVSLEDTPIDVVYCYADLHDPSLQRGNMGKSLQKNWDNNELMYSLRSVLKNIPWVRKIFIIMPNDKVKFLKEPKEISDKIVYIKDKDILGFDSASSICFEFSLWKLREFGCSENFIYLNDDWFIGKPLDKSDFFYVDNNKVVPYVIREDAGRIGQYNNMKSRWEKLRKYKGPLTHSGEAFTIQKLNTIMFLHKIFNGDILSSIRFPHNALGENLTELKELYDLVNNHYEYADDCLRAKTRNNNALQHQIAYSFYVINKYNRKINPIPHVYIDEKDVVTANFKTALYCINESERFSYSYIDRLKAKIKMEQLFSEPTKYERKDYNDWAGVDPALKERLENEMSTNKAEIKPASEVSMQKVVNNYRPRRSFRLRKAA